MSTTVVLSEDGDVVADSKAMNYAIRNIGKRVSIGTIVMLDSFRALRKLGPITSLCVEFEDGWSCDVDDDGRLPYLPENGIAVVHTKLLATIISG